jgi:O-antigen/teichoic acid export membrane protein
MSKRRNGRPRQRTSPHPGGTGAVLGVRLLRYSGVQGTALAVSNLIQLASIAVIANFLGPAELGRYALLMFLAGLMTQVMVMLVKPGTVRRTFGGGDDEDDDDDEQAERDVSASPQRTLGTGLAWAFVLGLIGTGLIVWQREPIADLLLGSAEDSNLVLWAGLLSGVWLVFKIADITIWLERRPSAFLLADTSRPALVLAAMVAVLATGGDVEHAMIATFAGTALAAALAVWLLRGSFEPSFDLREVGQIIWRGRHRAPIIMSFWLIQNADIFLLSRFVGDADLGIYHLASRVGFVVAFLPQGFRMALRPLRKAAIFQAVRDEYGQREQRGQLLGYFMLLCIFAVLAMVVGGAVIVDVAPPSYAAAAPLIPFTAAAFVMPSLYRGINQNVNIPHKRATFITGCVLAFLIFAGTIALLAPEIGIYAAPVGMLLGFGVPGAYMFLRCQLGKRPIRFPYWEVVRAVLLAAAIGAAFQALPAMNVWVELVVALVAVALYVVLLFVFRVVPENHWRPLMHMARSAVRGSVIHDLNPRAGLRSLGRVERRRLRQAVTTGLSADELRNGGGEELVASLRRVGERAGVPDVSEPSQLDAEIAVFLFERAPTAVRNASMRRLLSAGADSNELRALEELTNHLARAPRDAWKGKRRSEAPRRRRPRLSGRGR